MIEPNHKAIRRAILELLYQTYLDDPLRMVEPEAFLESPHIDQVSIVPNMHYLTDRKLVEMMMGYRPPMFSAVRITAQGIDLIENRFLFDLQFPAAATPGQAGLESIPALLERLVEEGDFAPIDGIGRKQILRDILYLREELSLPPDRWRMETVRAIIGGIKNQGAKADYVLPSLEELVDAIDTGIRVGRD